MIALLLFHVTVWILDPLILFSNCGCARRGRFDVGGFIEEHVTQFALILTVLMCQFSLPVPCTGLFLAFVQIMFRSKSWPSSHAPPSSFLSVIAEYWLTYCLSCLLSPAGRLHSSNGQFRDLPVRVDQSASINQFGPCLLAVLECDSLLLASSNTPGLAGSPG